MDIIFAYFFDQLFFKKKIKKALFVNFLEVEETEYFWVKPFSKKAYS